MNVKKILSVVILFATSLIYHTVMAQAETSTLSAGQKLTEGQRLVSANKIYYLGMQADGNLCIKKIKGNEFVWCSMAYEGSGSQLVLQPDGNLVVYNKSNKVVWNTMTQAYYDPKYTSAEWKPVRAVIEDNGILSLYSATNKKVWDNNYKGEQPTVPSSEGFVGQTTNKNLKVKLPFSNAAQAVPVQITNRGQVFYDSDMSIGNLATLNQNSGQFNDDKTNNRWKNSTIPYVLPESHPKKDLIKKGIAEINAKTNICLTPRVAEEDYVVFILDTGNWATLGMVGGKQEIAISNSPYLKMGTVCHEIMHSLGFYHTQSREDRDNFVTINTSNIQSPYQDQFYKQPDKASNLGVYDYGSCLHYFSTAFALNSKLNTISAKKGGKEVESLMGQRDSLSHMDILNIASVYPPCPSKAGKKLYVTKETANLPTNGISANNKGVTNTEVSTPVRTGSIPETTTRTRTSTPETETPVSVRTRTTPETTTRTRTTPETTQPTPVTTTPTPDKFVKSKSVLNNGETLTLGQTLTSDNNQYQCRIIKQSFDGGGGRMREQNRFIIDKITISNGMITNRTEIWNKECKDGVINASGGNYRYEECFYNVPPPSNSVFSRNAVAFGQLKLENDGKLKVYLDGYFTQELCPIEGKNLSASTTELHFKTSNQLALNSDLRLEAGKTLTSNNNQFQCRIKPDGNFVIERITLGTRENGEKFVSARTEIWNQPCKEGFIAMGNGCIVQPNCFTTPEIIAKRDTRRLQPCTPGSYLRLDDDGRIKVYKGANSVLNICDPYQR